MRSFTHPDVTRPKECFGEFQNTARNFFCVCILYRKIEMWSVLSQLKCKWFRWKDITSWTESTLLTSVWLLIYLFILYKCHFLFDFFVHNNIIDIQMPMAHFWMSKRSEAHSKDLWSSCCFIVHSSFCIWTLKIHTYERDREIFLKKKEKHQTQKTEKNSTDHRPENIL